MASHKEHDGSDEHLLHHSGESTSGGYSFLKPALRWTNVDGRRLLFATCACLTAASLFGLLSVMIWTQQSKYQQDSYHQVTLDQEVTHSTVTATHWQTQTETHTMAVTVTAPAQLSIQTSSPVSDAAKWKPEAVLKGHATESFRDNLLNGTKYISTWPSAGWTNDVMTYANLIYLAIITDRVPIIPPFVPSHIGGDAGSIAFGDVFNTTRLGESIGIPVIEWKDVKRPGSEVVDEVGCWDIWQATQYDEDFPRRSGMLTQLNLDVSYTRAPDWVKLIPGEVNDKHATFWSLAALAYQQTGDEAREGRTPRPSDQHHVELPPDDQLMCFDYLYYVCAQRPFEYGLDFSPAWRFSAQYMRWTDRLDQIADLYVRKALGTAEGAATPQYISVHVRRGDFANWCGDVPVQDCFAPISVIARRVREVQEEILVRKGFTVEDSSVIITSDEQDPEWWNEVRALGWKSPDHSTTQADYGRWYPVLVDAVIQSNGAGFVGTDRSTFSEMGERRCRSWHDGATRMFQWGHIGADDH